jgi:hypothetical protein
MQSKVAEPIERDEAQVLKDIASRRAALAAALREAGELHRHRCEMLVSASLDAVHEIDTVIDRAATKAEIAEAKVNALELELEGVYAAAREAETAADLARAQQLAEEAEQLIVRSYATAAGQIAETLARLATIGSELRALNARRPTTMPIPKSRRFVARRSVRRWRCPPSVRTMGPFGRCDLDFRRSTRSTRGVDGVTSTPVFGGNAQIAAIPGRLGQRVNSALRSPIEVQNGRVSAMPACGCLAVVAQPARTASARREGLARLRADKA